MVNWKDERPSLAGVILITSLLIIIFLWFKACRPEPVKHVSIQDTINAQTNRALLLAKQWKQIAITHSKRADSVVSVIPKAKIKYITKYVEIEKRIPVEYKPALDSLNRLKEHSDSLYQVAINHKDSANLALNKAIDQKDLALYNKDLLLGLKSDSLDLLVKEKKQRFWKGYWKGFRHGTVAGVMADEGLRFGIKKIIP